MELTKFSDYSLRLLIYLGLHRDRIVPLSEVANAYGISKNHLIKIASYLSQTGTIETLRGKGGGLRLALPPAEIKIGELVRSTEGHIPLVECFDPENNRCCISSSCSLKGVLKRAENAFYAELDKYTLAHLIRGKAQLLSALVASDA